MMPLRLVSNRAVRAKSKCESEEILNDAYEKLERFKKTLRRLCTEVEDLQIENSVYYQVIIEGLAISVPDLVDRVARARDDPKRRAEVHEMYLEMWQAVDETGTDAFFAALLKDLPPTDKPN